MKGFIFFILFLLITGCNQTRENHTPPCNLAAAVADYQLSDTDLIKLKDKVNQLYAYPDGTRPRQPLQEGEICHLIQSKIITLIDPAEIKNKSTEPEQDSVVAEPLDDVLYYIAINRFTGDTAIELKRFLSGNALQSAQGLVIDLRGNLGGTLYGVIKVAELLGQTNLIIGETKGTMAGSYYTDKQPSPLMLNKPMVVVVDDKTSSGAELLATFIQNHHLGTIIGEKTAGKGLVKTVARINQKTIMAVPVNYLFDSKGRAIEGNGIEPDIITSQTNCDDQYQFGLCKVVVQQALTMQ